MKGEPAAELGCCHKTKPLSSTGSTLSPSLDFQACQGNQVRWSPSPNSEVSLLWREGMLEGSGRKSEGTWIPTIHWSWAPLPQYIMGVGP